MERYKIRIGGHLFEEPKNLLKLEARENYTQIYFKSGKEVLVATTIGLLEKRLATFGFFRTHRGSMVNLSCIKILYKEGKYMKAELITNELMNVSKRRVKDLTALSQRQDIKIVDAFAA